MSIQRYEHQNACGEEYNCDYRKSPTGDVVFFSDHEAEVARLREALASIASSGEQSGGYLADLAEAALSKFDKEAGR